MVGPVLARGGRHTARLVPGREILIINNHVLVSLLVYEGVIVGMVYSWRVIVAGSIWPVFGGVPGTGGVGKVYSSMLCRPLLYGHRTALGAELLSWHEWCDIYYNFCGQTCCFSEMGKPSDFMVVLIILMKRVL